MQVLVTGGTGFLGSHTVSELTKNGHKVRLLVRSVDNLGPALNPFDVQEFDVVVGDVLDRQSIEKAAEGCDATIHCGSVYSLDPRAAYEIKNTNVTGTENVLDIACQLKHDPVIHVSSYVALIGKKNAVINQDSEPGNPPGVYFKSKADSDRVAREFQKKGAPVVITYPGSVWGPYDPHFGESCQMAKNILKGNWRFTIHGTVPISDVRDISKLHVALMEKGKGPRRYLTPMIDATVKGMIAGISEVTGRKLDTTLLPEWAILPILKGLDSLQKIVPGRFPVNFQAAYVTSLNHHADDSKTRNDFDIEPRQLKVTFEDQIRWMLQQGHINQTLAGTIKAN